MGNPLENIQKFDGAINGNPMLFLTNLKNIVKNVLGETRKLQIARQALKYEASQWFDACVSHVDNFEEFTGVFMEKYWGPLPQQNIRRDLEFGRYRPGLRLTREMYVIQKYARIKYLDPAMLEQDVVRQLARHFEPCIEQAVALQGIMCINELMGLVRRMDYVEPSEYGNNTQNPQQNGNHQSYPQRDGYNAENNKRKYDYRDNGQDYNDRRPYNNVNGGRNYNQQHQGSYNRGRGGFSGYNNR
jgi:hypothetical protein